VIANYSLSILPAPDLLFGRVLTNFIDHVAGLFEGLFGLDFHVLSALHSLFQLLLDDFVYCVGKK
jgi:hypothetical protein